MAIVGKYINSQPVNCVLFVLDMNYRVNVTLRRLINIIVTKVHPVDHDKLAIVINWYSHTPEAAKVRKRLSGGLPENESKQQRIDLLITALSGMPSFLLPAACSRSYICYMLWALHMLSHEIFLAAEFAKHENLKLTMREIESMRNRIFLVDSHYDSADMPEVDNDEQAFHQLRDWCISCDEINRRNVAQDTGEVYPV